MQWDSKNRGLLGPRHVNDDAVQVVMDDYLAGQATGGPPTRNELEDVCFISHGRADTGKPGRVDEAVAGRTGTAAAALRANASDAVVDGTVP